MPRGESQSIPQTRSQSRRDRGSSGRGGASSGTAGRGRVDPNDKREKKRRRFASDPADRPPSPPLPLSPTEYAKVTDQKLVTSPVLELIDEALKGAWRINKKNNMALIFDVINPASHYKRGELYDNDADDPFAVYNPSRDKDPDVTEDDGEGTAKPYAVVPHW